MKNKENTTGHLISCGKNYAEKCVDVLIDAEKHFIMRKMEQLVKRRCSLGQFRCFPMYRMYRKYNGHYNLSQKFSQNRHHFCQVLHVWTFLPFVDRYLFIQHSFPSKFREERTRFRSKLRSSRNFDGSFLAYIEQFFSFMRKMTWRCGTCGSKGIMRIDTTACYQIPWYKGPKWVQHIF